MSMESFLYCSYIAWLMAGSADFLCHRRSDLAHTSGVAESALHLVQLALLGCAILVVLAFEPGMVPALFLAGLVLAHAMVGYLDSRSAFKAGRAVRPIEQHIHSVLDMAPIIALGIFVVLSWPEVTAPAWGVEFRHSPLSIDAWASTVGPALVLCALPALMEFRSAWKARPRR